MEVPEEEAVPWNLSRKVGVSVPREVAGVEPPDLGGGGEERLTCPPAGGSAPSHRASGRPGRS